MSIMKHGKVTMIVGLLVVGAAAIAQTAKEPERKPEPKPAAPNPDMGGMY